MEDRGIVVLFLERKEEGISEARKKYGRYLHAIAGRFLNSKEDIQETVNDAMLGAWNSIPPHQPENLGEYLAKVPRRICVDNLRRNHRKKRGGGQVELSMEELSDCLPDKQSTEEQVEFQCLSESINQYLCSLPETPRQVFISRYFYADSIREIASNFHMSSDSVKSMLYRTRKGLKAYLETEGFAL